MNNFLNIREQILEIRENYLKLDCNAFKGNTSSRKNYVQQIEQLRLELSSFQKSMLIGLILSDASLDVDSNNATRITIQQSLPHIELLTFVKKVLLEYSGNSEPINQVPSKNRPNMREYQTLRMPKTFQSLVDLFHSETKSKVIKPEIEKEINAVVLAFWFMGDGGKRTYNNPDKGLSLHTQCFSKDECEILAQAILKNLNIKANVVLDSKEKSQYRIDISGTSYETFIEQVGPYILKCFNDRIPKGRSENSRYGYMTEERKSKILNSIINKVTARQADI
jgi:hypothetical protein